MFAKHPVSSSTFLLSALFSSEVQAQEEGSAGYGKGYTIVDGDNKIAKGNQWSEKGPTDPQKTHRNLV